MPIRFNPDRWEKIKETYGLWWEGKLNRPVIPVVLCGYCAGRARPDVPLLSQSNCNELSIPAEAVIDRIDYELSTYEFLGDAFPYFNLDCFGPGVAAAFLGANLDNSSGRVWFHPAEIRPINEMHFEYDRNNVWLNRIKDIYHAAGKRWRGQVIMGMTDLGGVLDILASMRTAENLLIDILDEPKEVERLVKEIHELWHRYFNEFMEILEPYAAGYSDWSGIFSEKPSYIPQSDFSYMIGPDMFRQFVKPELTETCRKIPHTVYHLDGIGQLNHLDMLVEIKELDAIQWVPGAGKPDQSYWPDVIKKIIGSGKGTQVFGGFECIDRIIGQLGSGKGINHSFIYQNNTEYDFVIDKLHDYGII